MAARCSRLLVASLSAFLWTVAVTSTVRAGIDGLEAEYRDGQVFLEWRETDIAPTSTLNVYMHDRPITGASLAQAVKIGHHVEVASARNWMRDPASFEKGDPRAKPVGFVIRTGGKPLDPTGGLFVHTVTTDDEGKRYYAVTFSVATGKAKTQEDATVAVGRNSLADPVEQRVSPIVPIWVGTSKPPKPPRGLPLVLSLHGRRGGRRQNYYDHVVFGSAEHGWREGLPFMFKVGVAGDAVVIMPSDRVSHPRGRAFHSFWYGYHSRIYSRQAMKEGGEVVNYGERRLLWHVRWAKRVLGTDPNRTSITGSSMGGCGAISMALHHPDVFAAVYAHVPIVSYTPSGPGSSRGSAWRITDKCGPLGGKVLCNEGMTVLERMNGVAAVTKARDLPFLYIVNGRQDRSIPWYNNPPFYKALNQHRHGAAIYWDDGDHPGTGRHAPADVKTWRHDRKSLLRFATNKSYPALSNCSDNRNPGNGHPTDGDTIGWINRGFDWRDVVDTRDRYAVTLSVHYPDIVYPVTVDMTPRRTQQFVAEPGDTFAVTVAGKASGKAVADARGLVTVKGIAIPSREGVRVEMTR